MQRRTKLPIVSLVGAGALLLMVLTAVVSPRPRAALAQDTPRVSVSMGDDTLRQGDSTYIVAELYNLPRHSTDNTKFDDLSYRYDLERNSGGNWSLANNCGTSLVGTDTNIETWYRSPLQVGGGSDNFSLSSTCPVGDYRVKVSVKDKSDNTVVVDGTREFTVRLGPSVTIELPPGPYYRGSSFNASIKFHELLQGSDYTYSAHVMNDNPNYAEECEGAGLSKDSLPNQNDRFTLSSVNGNPVVRTGNIASTCPTENYHITVKLYDSDNKLKGSDKAYFNIVMHPTVNPSASVSMSKTSPVAPGTEFTITVSFYDLQDGTNYRYRTDLTKRVGQQDVAETSCQGGSNRVWGHDVQGTVSRNPIVHTYTISSACPAGSYTLKSVIKNSSGSEIVSGSASFTIGNPRAVRPAATATSGSQQPPSQQQPPSEATATPTATTTPTAATATDSNAYRWRQQPGRRQPDTVRPDRDPNRDPDSNE